MFIPICSPDNRLKDIGTNGLDSFSSIPLTSILEPSVFYPASGLDADPVRILSRSIRSFVCCSYGITRSEFWDEISRIGFRGYKMTFNRDLRREDVVPNGWVPNQLPTLSDGNMSILVNEQARCDLFANWSIWKRDSDGHWFSFLYISGEACAVFQGLYSRLRIIPTVICVIQPGEAFGGNWTNFFEPTGFFCRTVCALGQPPYMLTGGFHGKAFFSKSCWPNYSLVAKPQPTFVPTLFGRNEEIGRNKVLRLWKANK